jgi:hypothetical protein
VGVNGKIDIWYFASVLLLLKVFAAKSLYEGRVRNGSEAK